MTPSALSFTASALMSLVIHAGLWIYLRHDIGDIDAKKRMNIPSGAVFFLVALASMSVSNRFLGPQKKRKARSPSILCCVGAAKAFLFGMKRPEGCIYCEMRQAGERDFTCLSLIVAHVAMTRVPCRALWRVIIMSRLLCCGFFPLQHGTMQGTEAQHI